MRGGAGIACIVALAIAAAGCGGGPSKRPNNTPSQGLQRTAKGGQTFEPVNLPNEARQLGALVENRTKSVESVRIAATTTAETSKGRVSIEITGALIKPTGGQVSAALKVVEVGGKDPGTTHIMVSGGTVYTRVIGESYALGKPWLRVTREDLANPNIDAAVKDAYREAVSVANSAIQQASTDKGVAMLTYGRLVENPVWEKLGGVDVRRYDGTTEVEKMAKLTNDPLLLKMSTGDIREFPWTVHVDKYGLPRHFSSTVTLPGEGEITSRATYSGWGQPLTINFPPPSLVATLEDR